MMRRQRRREQHVRQTYNDTAARYEQTDEGLLEPETPTERTHKTQQKAIVEATSANAAANAWRKALPKGPYGINVARTGRHAVCYGAGGRGGPGPASKRGHGRGALWRSLSGATFSAR